jgi:hypothetical protein
VPQEGGFALVGDADRADVLRLELGFFQYIAANVQAAGPDLFAVVLDPAVLWKVLLELGLGNGNGVGLGVKNNGAAAGSALVDGENMLGHGAAVLVVIAFNGQ